MAATKTYTTELLADRGAVGRDVGRPGRCRGARRDPRRDGRDARLEPDVEAMAADQAGADRALVLARGYEYATAREWALKLKELARVFADPYSAADFEHGPLALLEPGVPVLAIVRPGPTAAALVELLGAPARATSTPTSRSSPTSPTPSGSPVGRSRWLPAPPEWLGPIVSIVVGQLHALHLTRARGLDPERAAQPQQGDPHALSDLRNRPARRRVVHPSGRSERIQRVTMARRLAPSSGSRPYTAGHARVRRRIDATRSSLAPTLDAGRLPR